MRAVDVIRHKRDGGTLSAEEIAFFIDGVTSHSWEMYQISAMLMAIVWRGLNDGETAELTARMVKSGVVLDWSDIPGKMVDKHSAGGVGDKTSLVLVPLAAACGCKIPKMSGRGLAHTGGTLDKLEAIPGYRINISPEEFKAIVREVGCAIVGQTANLAPADKKLYSIRDVTATVESIPLIAGSIMSKKLAEGIQGVVLDVKAGRGAFMKTRDDARQLAQTMVNIGQRNGVRTVALLTDMNQPLGYAIGNSLEVMEAVQTLQGQGPRDLEQLSVRLAAWLVVLSDLASSLPKAEEMVQTVLANGKGFQKFCEMCARLGGDVKVLEDISLFPQASGRYRVLAKQNGFVQSVHAEHLGRSAMLLGAGRARVEDSIDHAVGAVMLRKPGDAIQVGEALVELHYNHEARLHEAIPLAEQAFEMGDKPPKLEQLILETVG
ncbi:MAG: thymidine phosphorylase [Planctomycetia bacterium]|nr:thymidine phosphorylase [Planctomycetia bacterium]